MNINEFSNTLRDAIDKMEKLPYQDEKVIFPGWDEIDLGPEVAKARREIKKAARAVLADGKTEDEMETATIGELISLLTYIADMTLDCG